MPLRSHCLADRWPTGVGRLIFDSLPSTNAFALAHGDGPLWIMARQQTAGRGRRAREWVSPQGNLYATVLLHPNEPPATTALRSFVAALALGRALEQVTGTPDAITLKWPNDVLYQGQKIAGILLEAAQRDGRPCLAIGFGVNLISAPDASVVEAGAVLLTSVQSSTGQIIAPEDFLTALAAAYTALEAEFVQHGFAPIRAAWLARAARLGDTIRARTGHDTFEGIFESIDTVGNLILITAKGRMAIPAADVFF